MGGVPPPDRVLDLFAVPGDTRALPGGQGQSVLAGDLVLSPGRDPVVAELISPVLARLAVEMDTRRGRRRRDLRLAVPVPARDGAWTVDGWAASRYEPGTHTCDDLPVVRAAGAVLHAELALAVPTWPLAQTPARGRWSRAERAAFAPDPDLDGVSPAVQELAYALLAERTCEPLGADQLVHGDLAGNVLLDEAGAPVVIDVAPYWRPVLWADAVCVLDSVMWHGADPKVLEEWVIGSPRQAMLRAGLYRLLADDPAEVEAYRRAVGPVLGGERPTER